MLLRNYIFPFFLPEEIPRTPMSPLLILSPLPLAAHAARIMPSAFYAPSPVIGYSGSGPVYNFGQISSTGHLPWMLAEDILKGLGTSSPNHGSW